MQSAETVLGVLRERGRRHLPCQELYRQLFNPQLYLLAYGRIYANKGAMTPGATQETVDGMSMGKIGRIIDAMRHERYRFSPVRRVLIPKPHGGTRPLGLPSWSDKLVGEVVRLLLEAYYEPQFSDRSHGFRPRKGCHTALREIGNTWTGTTWFIEADIADCFGSLDHQKMLEILGKDIHDERFLRLVGGMLTAGYLEDWKYGATLSGVSQGGTASPILSNIYLHQLDMFVEQVLIPEYTRGRLRQRNPAYRKVEAAVLRARRRGDRALIRSLRREQLSLPSQDPDDPGYRRLRYLRYADDHLLGFSGPKAEAQEIKQRLAVFLRDELKLELSPSKTLITHARTGAARFLGYEITIQSDNRQLTKGRRAVNGQTQLRVPLEVIKAKCGPFLTRGRPARQNPMIRESDYTIVASFGARYRGIVQYYLLAGDVHRLHRLRWVMETSMLHTLAAKHRSSVSKMARQFKAKTDTPHGLRTCFEARFDREGRPPLVARFAGIPLKRQKMAVLTDREPIRSYPDKELIGRLLVNRCELCHSTEGVQVHHIRKLADLTMTGTPPEWLQFMGNKRRKSLVVCDACHEHIHHRRDPARSRSDRWRAGCRETGLSGSEGGHAEKDPPQWAPRRVVDPTRTVREQFLVEVADRSAEELAADGVSPAAALMELNRLFTAWVEVEYHRRVHTETGQSPLQRWEDGWTRLGRSAAMPTSADLTEAFLWSEYRTVTKTATVSLHGNTYQVQAVLAGRKVELVFSPFDLETLQVRYDGSSYGQAVPHLITRHTHPKARPEIIDPQPATPSGIDYLALTAAAHHEQVRDDHRIGFHALYGSGDPTDATGSIAAGQVPGQLALTDLIDADRRVVS